MTPERCVVSVLEAPATAATGPTPVGAPFLANDLVEQVLAQLSPAVVQPTVRIAMDVEPLATFSWELRFYIVAQLAQAGAALELQLNTPDATFVPFHADELYARIDVWTKDRDPGELTTRLGVAPDTSYRAGDVPQPGKPPAASGLWRIEHRQRAPIDADAAVHALRSRLPAQPALDGLETTCRLWFDVHGLHGGFRLGREAIAAIAVIGAGLPAYFWNA